MEADHPLAVLGRDADASVLNRVRVVLSHPSHPGNIGAAARALKTMGLSRLVLVNPREFPSPEARARAAGADDVLEGATVCDSLGQALHGCVFVAAVTARRRELTTPMCWARDAAAELVAEARQGEVALVFGNETAGLTNAEVAQAHMTVLIPANPDYKSLNLGAAVQVLCYELRMAAMQPGAAPAVVGAGLPATQDDVERLVTHFERALVASGFLDPKAPKRLIPRLRRLFARARIEQEEVAILRGALSSFEKK